MALYQLFTGRNTEVPFAPRWGYVNNYVLSVGVNTQIIVPEGINYVVFNASNDIWVNINATAIVPTANVTDGTGSELNPVCRRVNPGDVINIISEYTAKVCVVFYE
jgi:hypothetical protein